MLQYARDGQASKARSPVEEPHDRHHPRLRRLALRQRRPARRAPGRRLPAGRHLRPLPSPEGQPRADGLRLGLARHAHHRRGRQARRNTAPRSSSATTSASWRPCRPSGSAYDLFTHTDTENHHRIAQDILHAPAASNDYLYRERAAAAVLRDREALSAGPLRRGHLPDLRLRARPRRPVRQLRQPARRHRADQPAQQDRRLHARSSARPSTSSSTCPRSPQRLLPYIEAHAESTGVRTSSTSPATSSRPG